MKLLTTLPFKWSEFSQLIYLAIPILISQIAQMGMGVTDIIIAGHYDELALSAVSLGVSIWHPMMLFVLGTLMSFAILGSHHYGAQKTDHIAMILRDGIPIILSFTIIAITIMHFPQPILRFFGVASELIVPTTRYLHGLSIGVPAMFGFLALRFLAEGVRRPTPVMFVSLTGLIMNAILNYSFMHGLPWIGLPSFGVFGSGIGTGLTFWIMLMMMVICVHYDHRLSALKLWQAMGYPRLTGIKEILKLGIPNGASIFAEASIFSVAGLLLGQFGKEIVGSHQIALNISGVMFMMPLSISFALTATVGQALGRRDYQAATRIGYMGIMTCLGLMFITATFLFTFRHWIPTLFTNHADIVMMSAGLLVFAAIFQLSDGLQVAAAGVLRGMKDTKIPMLLTISSYWLVGMPLGYYLGLHLQWKAPGIWVGLIVGLSVSAILLNIRVRRLATQFNRLESSNS